jgi:hypothetical protein
MTISLIFPESVSWRMDAFATARSAIIEKRRERETPNSASPQSLNRDESRRLGRHRTGSPCCPTGLRHVHIWTPRLSLHDRAVYRVPPLKSNEGYRANDWGDLETPLWKGRLRIIETGAGVSIRLEDSSSGPLIRVWSVRRRSQPSKANSSRKHTTILRNHA